MNITYIIVPNLALFDGAAAGAAVGAGEGAAQATGGAESTPTGKAAEPKVVYGKQTGTPDAPQDGKSKADGTPESDADRRARYRSAISGEFRDLYTEDTQQMINKRFKETKELEAKVAKQQEIIDRLAQRYEVDASNPEEIGKRLDEDYALWEEPADAAGMSVQAYLNKLRLERENEALMRAENARRGEEAAKATLAKWAEEEQALKAKVPGFNLRAEAQNPSFVAMLRAGTPMEHAYKVIHMDEIMSGAVQQTQAVTEQRVTANIRAKGSRPAEAGLGGQSGTIVKDDVSKLTKADRAEIARRAMRGEIITF